MSGTKRPSKRLTGNTITSEKIEEEKKEDSYEEEKVDDRSTSIFKVHREKDLLGFISQKPYFKTQSSFMPKEKAADCS